MGEGFAGIGLMLGPVIGSIINNYLGYSATFFTFAGFIGIGGLISFIFLPKSLN